MLPSQLRKWASQMRPNDHLRHVAHQISARTWTPLIALWQQEFPDVRLILERKGALQYFQLTGRVQRRLVRLALSVSAVSALSLLLLLGHTVRTAVTTARIEREQQQAIAALRALDPSFTHGSVAFDTVAKRVLKRESNLRALLQSSLSALRNDNQTVWNSLQASGVGDDRFEAIRDTLPAGGPENTVSAADEVAGEEVLEAVSRNRELKEVLRALPSRMPLEDAAITSDFGLRLHPILRRADEHHGLDMYSRVDNDSVRAVASGVVKEAAYKNGYGNMVLLQHAGGIQTLYGHMAGLRVSPGQSVKAGMDIGRVGNTGLSTGKHLHFEILVGGVPLDPEKVVSAARILR